MMQFKLIAATLTCRKFQRGSVKPLGTFSSTKTLGLFPNPSLKLETGRISKIRNLRIKNTSENKSAFYIKSFLTTFSTSKWTIMWSLRIPIMTFFFPEYIPGITNEWILIPFFICLSNTSWCHRTARKLHSKQCVWFSRVVAVVASC